MPRCALNPTTETNAASDGAAAATRWSRVRQPGTLPCLQGSLGSTAPDTMSSSQGNVTRFAPGLSLPSSAGGEAWAGWAGSAPGLSASGEQFWGEETHGAEGLAPSSLLTLGAPLGGSRLGPRTPWHPRPHPRAPPPPWGSPLTPTPSQSPPAPGAPHRRLALPGRQRQQQQVVAGRRGGGLLGARRVPQGPVPLRGGPPRALHGRRRLCALRRARAAWRGRGRARGGARGWRPVRTGPGKAPQRVRQRPARPRPHFPRGPAPPRAPPHCCRRRPGGTGGGRGGAGPGPDGRGERRRPVANRRRRLLSPWRRPSPGAAAERSGTALSPRRRGLAAAPRRRMEGSAACPRGGRPEAAPRQQQRSEGKKNKKGTNPLPRTRGLTQAHVTHADAGCRRGPLRKGAGLCLAFFCACVARAGAAVPGWAATWGARAGRGASPLPP